MNQSAKTARLVAQSATVLMFAALPMTGCDESSRALPPNYDAFAQASLPPQMSPRLRELIGKAAVGQDELRVEPRLGVPSFFMPKAGTPLGDVVSPESRAEDAARAYLRAHAPLYRLGDADVDKTVLAGVHDVGRGPVIARFQQQVFGIRVFRDELRVVLDRSNRVVALSGYLTGDAATSEKAGPPQFLLDPREAVALAITDLGGAEVPPDSLVVARETSGGYGFLDMTEVAKQQQSMVLTEPARFTRVMYHLPDGLVPAYYTEVGLGVAQSTESAYYSYVISAKDGRVLFRNNLTADSAYTYRVWADAAPPYTPYDGPQGTDETPHATGDAAQPIAETWAESNLLTLENGPISTGDRWLPPGATETRGNNVQAYADIARPNGYGPGDLAGVVSAPMTFDYSYDVTENPDASDNQRLASVTQLFFVNNWLHDWFYDAGFDEVAGNAQRSNYGRGGLEGDSLRVESQDYGGMDNANMSTPADGASPRMQMYKFAARITKLTAQAPQELAGDYQAGTGSWNSAFDVTAAVVRSAPLDGCAPFTNAGVVRDNIVFIDRGTCTFAAKAAEAQRAGAAGMIVANLALNGDSVQTMPGSNLTIPAMLLGYTNAQKFRSALDAANTVMVRMFLGGVARDGALDTQIVAHEWGHYLSNRLIGDANGLGTTLARGLGEGWGDFVAMLVSVRPGDNYDGVYSMGSYAEAASDPNAYYWGVRRCPYSTQFSKNPLTYKYVADENPVPAQAYPNCRWVSNPNSEVHNSGEIWASMLWQCYAYILRDTTGEAPRLSFHEAQERMKYYLVASLKATPSQPTLLEARDALLAVMKATDGEDFERCVQAFADRGAGAGAEDPTDRYSTTNNGVVESNATGSYVVVDRIELDDSIAPLCGQNGGLSNGETGSVRVWLKNVGTAEAAGVNVVVSSSTPSVSFPNPENGSAYIDERIQALGGVALVSVPVQLTGATGIISIELSATATYGSHSDTATESFLGNYDDVPYQATVDTVEAELTPWMPTSDSQFGPSEMWHRHALAVDSHVWHGPDVAVPSDIYLISPALAVKQTGDFVMIFRHAYSFESALHQGSQQNFDGGVIEVTSDGVVWEEIDPTMAGYTGQITELGQGPLANRWAYTTASANYPNLQPVRINFGTKYAGKEVFVRLRIATDEGTGADGWFVDDISFENVARREFPSRLPHADGCPVVPAAQLDCPQAVFEQTEVVLRGEAWTPGIQTDLFTYAWEQFRGPTATLSANDSAELTFTAPDVTTDTVLGFVFQAQSQTSGLWSAPATAAILVVKENQAPTANAGCDQEVDERSLVTLDAASSADPDGDALVYTWRQTDASGITVVPNNPDTASPTFVAPEVATDTTLSFEVTVTDGAASSSDAVNVLVRQVNRAPTANAGSDTLVFERTVVTLDGSASFDADVGTSLTYTWTRADLLPVATTLSDASAASPTFIAPEVTEATTLLFALEVSDGELVATDTVSITVGNVNRAPLANAGGAFSVAERSVVDLDGSGSYDPDGDTLNYFWRQIAGPMVAVLGADTTNLRFVAPEVSSDTLLSFELYVSDGNASATDVVDVNVQSQNRDPIAFAGAPQSVLEGALVRLDGSRSSDPDNDALTFAWVKIDTTDAAVVLSDPAAAAPTFTAPAVSASTTLQFELRVSDGMSTATDTVLVTVEHVNLAPVADAGMDIRAAERSSVTLVGSGFDADGDALRYFWRQVGGPAVALIGVDLSELCFIAPEVTADTLLTFELSVSDGSLSASDTVSVTVHPLNRAPVAQAGVGQAVDEGALVTLDSTQSYDPDGDALGYVWAQVDTTGVVLTLENATSATPSFAAPAVAADVTFVFEVEVSDGAAKSTAKVQVMVHQVNAAPRADAGDDREVNAGDTVLLDGSHCSDADGDSLRYYWTQAAGPVVVGLGNATTAEASFVAPSLQNGGTFVFSLSVSDRQLVSDPASVTITVRPRSANEEPSGCQSTPTGAGGLQAGAMAVLLLLLRRRGLRG